MTGQAVRRVRHVDVDASLQVDLWPYEAVIAVLERGSIRDWAVLTAAIAADPWGPVARQVEEHLEVASEPALVALLSRAIARSRHRAEQAERDAVAARVNDLVNRSGFTAGDFAERVGTSASRLSTYRHGRVTPSAALMHRIERVAADGARRAKASKAT